MKVFVFIMSFYLLYLPCVPCGDAEECRAKTDQKISVSANHEEHHHDDECCSPFCTCSCCSSLSITSSHLKVLFTSLYIVRDYSPFISPSIKGVSLPIWQPPQLIA